MSDWQVGDLAVCIDASDVGGAADPNYVLLEYGRVYNVIGITDDGPGSWVSDYDGLGLILAEVESTNPEGDFAAYRFRKVLPDRHEACETEFVDLLKRSKRRVEA
jgi:hypothetical protein